MITDWDDGIRDSIAEYLTSGLVVSQWLMKHCLLMKYKSQYVYAEAMELADGTWVWPASLAYYVELFGIGLPSEFIQHASSTLFKCCNSDLAGIDKRNLEYGSILWDDYCLRHRKNRVFAGISRLCRLS